MRRHNRWVEGTVFEDDEDEEERREEKAKMSVGPSCHTYTWSANGSYSFEVISYTIQKYMKGISSDFREERLGSAEFEYDYGRRAEILTRGKIIFAVNGRIFVYSADCKDGTNSIYSNHDIGWLVETLKKEIRENNPLRNKHIQVVDIDHGTDFCCLLKKPPSITFNDIVLDGAMKEDIFDNTIFHLKSIKGNNGIILHGDPGTGKSMICQAVINEALKEGYSTCFVTVRVDYAMLSEFLTTFFGRCIVIFEDIDSIGQNRENVLNSHLSDFLQFISGLYEREDGMVFIATTNYIEHLDRAIANRPVRFNRKFRIELPTDGDIRRLVALYFKDAPVEPEFCCGKKFTGAHIKEIHRTAELLSLKRGVPVAETYGDAVRFVERNFTTQATSPGF